MRLAGEKRFQGQKDRNSLKAESRPMTRMTLSRLGARRYPADCTI
jgi:hypothetical protein